MYKRIYLNMLILVFSSVITTTGLLSYTFYDGFSSRVKGEIKNKSVLLKSSLELQKNAKKHLIRMGLSGEDIRITLVAANGKVLYDNTARAETLENHGSREEIVEALKGRVGEGRRISDTIGKETYYYAVKLSDGSVLRVAKTVSSIYGLFLDILPRGIIAVIVLLLVCVFTAKSLTNKIVNPINTYDFDSYTDTYDELSPFIRTITAQKKQIKTALEEIERKNEAFEIISGRMNEGLILTDKHGIVLTANKSAINILGITTSPIGRNLLELTRVISVVDYTKSALDGNSRILTFPMGHKVYQVFFSNVDKGAMILFLDITEKAESEKMRKEFSANVSHELKTPLTSIYGYAELLTNKMVKAEDVAKIGKHIEDESGRLIALIDDIIRLSQLDEADKGNPYAVFDLIEVIKEAADALTPKTQAAGISVEIPSGEFPLSAHRAPVYEMMYNLIENAIKYNKPSGRVEVSAIRNTEGRVEIKVKDTGIGIPPEYFDRIFERFYRIDQSRSKRIEGTGLGLSIVKHAAMYHGGTVTVKSMPELKEGTEFTVILN